MSELRRKRGQCPGASFHQSPKGCNLQAAYKTTGVCQTLHSTLFVSTSSSLSHLRLSALSSPALSSPALSFPSALSFAFNMSGCGSATCGCGSACKCGSSCQCKNTMDDAMLVLGGSSKSFEMDFGSENDCKCGANCKCADCQCHQ